MHWNIYITDAKNLLLHVSAVYGCLHFGIFTVAEAVLTKWSVAFSSHTLAHVIRYFFQPQEQPVVKCNNVKTIVEILRAPGRL
jgi:hypothetical protein